MNVYDTARRKGSEPRDGVAPRLREAVPGSSSDEVYASRYHRVIADELVSVEFTSSDAPPVVPVSLVKATQDAISDETPPDARRRK